MSKTKKAALYFRKSTEKEDCSESFIDQILSAIYQFEKCAMREKIRRVLAIQDKIAKKKIKKLK